jgi:hypothetical protein
MIVSGEDSTTASNRSTYIVYGNASGANVAIDASGNIASSLGFKINGAVGYSVANGGDINGDGLTDLLLSAREASSTYSYNVILGGTQWVTAVVNGSGAVTGTASGEAIIGSAGSDTLTGGGGVDRFFAGMGNDTLVMTASDITNLANNTTGQTAKSTVNGGTGFDSIRLSGGASMDLTAMSNASAMGLDENSRIESIERIDLATDTSANTLTLAARDVKDMAGFNLIRTGSVSADGRTWTNVTGSTRASGTLTFESTPTQAISNFLYMNTTQAWQLANGTNSGDADLEDVLYSGGNTGHYRHLDNTTIPAGNAVSSISASFKFAMNQVSGQSGDGMNFSFGDKTSLNTVSLELGYAKGLSVKYGGLNVVAPDQKLRIYWNGVQVAVSTSDITLDTSHTTSVTVTDAGLATVLIDGVSVATATISGWQAANKSGWEFGYGGRTGTAVGNAWIDDFTATATTLPLSSATNLHQLVVDGSSNDTVVLSPDTGFWSDAGTVSNGSSNYTVYQNALTNTQMLVKSDVVVTNNDPNSAPDFSSTSATAAAGLLPVVGGTPVWNRTASYGSSSLGGITTNITATGDSTPTRSYGTGSSAFMWIGDQNMTETLSVSFDKPVYQVKIEFESLNNDGTNKDTLSFQVNGVNLVLSSANLSPSGTSVSGNTIIGSGGGVYSITSSTAINSLSVTDTIIGGPSGVGVVVQYNSAPLQASGGVAIGALMPSGTDAGGSVVGYAITSAASETGADTTPGSWQYFNGSTWTSLAGASVSQAVYLTASTLVRWNDNDQGYTALSAVAVDSSAAATLGQTLNVTTRGGLTAFSTGIATLAATIAPVVLDLNRDGQLSYGQVTMDVNGDGHLDTTAWAAASDGVLVWDKYADGLVHNNSQYAFAQYATTYRMGQPATDLQGLADAFDSNRDGVFDAQDAQFAEFKVWQDADQDGVSDAGEVRSLSDWGIASINLVSDGVVRQPAPGVTEAGRSTALAVDGSTVLVGDVSFEVQSLAYRINPEGDLSLLGAEMALDLASFVAAYGVIQSVDLSGTGGNTFAVALHDVLSSETDGPLRLTGDEDDCVVLKASEWVKTGNVEVGGQHYAAYASAYGLPAGLLLDPVMLERWV